MSEGIVTCPFCHEDTADAGIIRISMAGDKNHVQLFICPDCEESANPGSHGDTGTGISMVDVLRDVVLKGVRSLAGLP